MRYDHYGYVDWDAVRDIAKLRTKTLVKFANLYEMNVIASNPIMEGQVRAIDIPSIGAPTTDTDAKHLQLIRSMPQRCLISTMCGMKSLTNVKTNYEQVLTQEPLTKEEFLEAMTNLVPRYKDDKAN